MIFMCQSWLKNASFQQERERKKLLISWHLQPAALVSRAVLQRSRMSFQMDVNHGSESFPVNTVIERLKVYRQGTDSICYSLCLVYSNSICARQQQVTISLTKKIERLRYVFLVSANATGCKSTNDIYHFSFYYYSRVVEQQYIVHVLLPCFVHSASQYPFISTSQYLYHLGNG